MLNLQLVFVVRVQLGQVTKLLCQVQAVGDVFWRHEIFRHFDAVVKIPDLVGCSCRYKDGVAHALDDGIA